ncbi:hypothetical protein ALC62_04265 [Cyphomyrmex costatus]|uniref:Uncharacterized protein n=1 Tax=Cyphomyrmex costatus TaxID=456900 RepID=A0A195CW27_9HYME|nr:hypothetical protein ALC62_04265 [Cyphomyrmex costatus]
MGNTESNVASSVKKQTDTSSILLYKLVDLKGERNNKMYNTIINLFLSYLILTSTSGFIYQNEIK